MEQTTDREAVVARLRALLEEGPVPGVMAAYVFGSVAEARAHRESDLDVGILFDRRVYPDDRSRFEARLELSAHLSPSAVGREVDLVVLNDAPALLGRRITRGLLVYAADAAQVHDFERDVQLRAADLAPFVAKMRRRLLASLVS